MSLFARWFGQAKASEDLWIALAFLLIFCGLPIAVCEYQLASDTKLAASVSTPPTETIDARQFATLVARLDKQKEQRSQWAYAAIVALVAILVVKRTFQIPWIKPAYLSLGTAGVLMFESIRAGDLYEQNVAWLTTLERVDGAKFKVVNAMLWRQLTWLNYATVALLLFIGMFLVAVVSGNVHQEGSDE